MEISKDQNTITHEGKVYEFKERAIGDYSCLLCSLNDKCLSHREVPCAPPERIDNLLGYFILAKKEIITNKTEIMKNKVIKVKSVEHGKKVIEYLKQFGENGAFCDGSFIGYYYGIDNNGYIFYCNKIPSGYAEIELPTEEIKLPQVMWVWDNNKSKKEKRVVYNIDPNLISPVNAYANCKSLEDVKEGKMQYFNWFHCEPIKEPSRKEILQCKLEELKATTQAKAKELQEEIDKLD